MAGAGVAGQALILQSEGKGIVAVLGGDLVFSAWGYPVAGVPEAPFAALGQQRAKRLFC